MNVNHENSEKGHAGQEERYQRSGTRRGKKLGVALVGLGTYSATQLAPALLETEHCYLAGIVTGTPSKIDQWKEKYDISDGNVYNYDNFDEIANNPDIDIVYVVLPNSMHAEYTIRAARAKKHVICEKPMAIDVEEAQKMLDACRENDVQLAIGYTRGRMGKPMKEKWTCPIFMSRQCRWTGRRSNLKTMKNPTFRVKLGSVT